MTKTISLHSRLLLASIIPTVVFMAIFSLILVLFRFQDIESLQAESGNVLLGRYALAIAAQPDSQYWPAILQGALEEKYLRSIALMNTQGQTIAHAGPQLTTTLTAKALASLTLHKAARLNAKEAYIYLQPVAPKLNQPLYLVIELSPSAFTIARYESIIGVSISAFGLISLLMLLMSGGIRRWLAPINLMVQQITSIDSQTLNKRLKTPAVGDLALLEQVINDFLQSMEHEHEELKHSIEQANADLDENLDTMEAQNIELRMARNEAIEGNRIKSAFLANISHELRTPLNSINGFTQVLLKMPLANKQRDCVETIQKSSNNLLAIINDVLDFSKIEAGKFSLEKQPLWLEDVIFDVLESLSPQAAQKNLEQVAFIYDDVPKKIIGDALRLKQVLTNLVSNAIKFTPSGEVVVRVMMEDSRPTHNLLRISISDTGIGLSETTKSDLFTAFQQGNPSVSRQFGGTGLGLVISKNIVKLMEGEISFEAQQEKGSTFWFTFKAGICHDPLLPPINLTGKKILALETHDKNAQLLKSTLYSADADTTVVGDWPKFMALASDGYHVLLFNDQAVDDKNKLIQLSQARQHFHGMMVMFSSIGNHVIDEQTLANLGIYSLTKPLRPRNLLSLLAQGFLTAKINPHSLTTIPPTPVPTTVRQDLHILAVDDHPLNLKLVYTLLTDMGLQVSTAKDGKEAVELAQQRRFDLILMDIQMPEMSGLEATKLIRQQETDGQHVPIVALTAHALADEKELMLAQGMNDYLTKPLQESQLVHMIQHWTGKLLHNQATHHTNALTDSPHQALALVDWPECLQLAAGKIDLAQDMLEMLLKGLPTQREKLHTSHSEQNFPALLAHTHYLHGATRYCGVPRLRHAAQRLETRLKIELKNPTDTQTLTERLTEDMAYLLTVIDELMDWQQQRQSEPL